MGCFAVTLLLLAAKKSQQICRGCQAPRGLLRTWCPQSEGKNLPREDESITVTGELNAVGSKDLCAFLPLDSLALFPGWPRTGFKWERAVYR